ncbi:MAG: hypothetical protein DDT20_00017 [Firmicutes bacterium]|nr:hypothetical protein [Bacillota bacterium]
MELLVVVSIIAVVSALVVTRILPAAAGTSDMWGSLMEREWEASACRFNQNIVQNATEYFAVMENAGDGSFCNRDPSPDCSSETTVCLFAINIAVTATYSLDAAKYMRFVVNRRHASIM